MATFGSDGPMSVGVMGGAFNPIHIGHLNTACEVAYKMNLTKVIFVVSARPPHKDQKTLISSRHRYEMVKIACKGNHAFEASNTEIDRPGLSYTIDTMRGFTEEYGKKLYFILGQDALEDIGQWKSAATLLKTFNFICVTRPGYDSTTLMDLLLSVISLKYRNVKLNILSRTDDGEAETIGIVGSDSVIKLVKVTPLDVSSTDIRERIRNDEPLGYLVPEGVRKYIKENNIR